MYFYLLSNSDCVLLVAADGVCDDATICSDPLATCVFSLQDPGYKCLCPILYGQQTEWNTVFNKCVYPGSPCKCNNSKTWQHMAEW